MEVKYRISPAGTYQGETGFDGIFGKFITGTPSYTLYNVSQEVHTEGHPIRALGKVLMDIGGPFANRKVSVTFQDSMIKLSESPGSIGRYCEGILLPSPDVELPLRGYSAVQLAQTCPQFSEDADLDEFGTTAISRVAPANPLVEGATAIAELTTGRPRAPGEDRTAAGEYLNYEFGIKPTIDDIRGIRSSAKKADALIRQLRRDSGRPVRRRYEEDIQHVPAETSTSSAYPFMVGGGLDLYTAGQGTLTTTVKTSQRKWFSGSFMYHLGEVGTFDGRLDELDYLYGIKPGVDTAWNALPYSWLVDWYSNAGDVVHNMSRFAEDGLVMNYGYVMAEKSVVKNYSWTGPLCFSGVWETRTVTATVVEKSQQRLPATPFGFGFSWDGMTVRQGAILAALGITRMR